MRIANAINFESYDSLLSPRLSIDLDSKNLATLEADRWGLVAGTQLLPSPSPLIFNSRQFQ